ncbi:MAG TPA: SDR family NAD(P)-dependent oxidoreductase [Acidimicrobiia bacterium]|nr:SDR family NAD(P)-dependent oxidoreductase [Acidimicrobiia bacterium]
MSGTLIWISGANGGIGQGLIRTVPWEGARIIGIGRHQAPGTDEHVAADLAEPEHWERAAYSFEKGLSHFEGDRVVFVHAAGTLHPIGFAGEVDSAAYLTNVIVNSASPQALGQLFIQHARQVRAKRHCVIMTSGAARSVYPGWSSYGAAKAAVDQWVRDVGAEQELRGGGVQVLAIGPGTVDTGMQALMRATPEEDFPSRQKFIELFEAGKLVSPDEVGRGIWACLDAGLPNGSVLDLRDRPAPTP